MTERIARGVGPHGVDLAYEQMGDASAPTVLLIMGLGAQMLQWPDGLCAMLVERGLHVVRYDNRDSGRSTQFSHATPDLGAALAGDTSSAPYTLSDMAADGVGLLDHLGVQAAHVVGASMGGMIAQLIAIEHPTRVRSLTSIMSTTGDPHVGRATHETLVAMFGSPPSTTREQAMERAIKLQAFTGSPGYELDEAAVRAIAARSFDRNPDRTGILRHSVAIIASGDRTPRLRSLSLPTLVIHGLADNMCDASGGRATAAAIPGAELLLFDGMGHHLPRQLWPELAARIDVVVRRGEARVG